jgi:hypothetical protein
VDLEPIRSVHIYRVRVKVIVRVRVRFRLFIRYDLAICIGYRAVVKSLKSSDIEREEERESIYIRYSCREELKAEFVDDAVYCLQGILSLSLSRSLSFSNSLTYIGYRAVEKSLKLSLLMILCMV